MGRYISTPSTLIGRDQFIYQLKAVRLQSFETLRFFLGGNDLDMFLHAPKRSNHIEIERGRGTEELPLLLIRRFLQRGRKKREEREKNRNHRTFFRTGQLVS